jgi:hypothetical protein
MDQVVECEHCRGRLFVLAQRLPVMHVERDAGDGSRFFLLICGDDWLLHRRVIVED